MLNIINDSNCLFYPINLLKSHHYGNPTNWRSHLIFQPKINPNKKSRIICEFYFLDCPDLKASNTAELSSLINRLERICERLERAVSAHALDTANQQLNTNLQTTRAAGNNQANRNSDEIDNLPLPSLPTTPSPCSTQSVPQESITTLEADEIFSSNNIENYCDLATPTPPPPLSSTSTDITATPEDIDLNIPTVVTQLEDSILFNEQSPADYTPPKTMSVYGFQDILNGPFAQYLQLSAKIGGDVATHASVVKKAFE